MPESHRSPGCGGGAPRGGSAGSQAGGAAPRRPCRRRASRGGRRGEGCGRPRPRAPALPSSSSLLGPRPRSTSSLFSKVPRPGLFVPPRAPAPRTAPPESPRAGKAPSPAHRPPPGAAALGIGGARKALPEQSFARWGPPGGWGLSIFALDLFLTHLRGRGTVKVRIPGFWPQHLTSSGLPGTVPVLALKVPHPSVRGGPRRLVRPALPLWVSDFGRPLHVSKPRFSAGENWALRLPTSVTLFLERPLV